MKLSSKIAMKLTQPLILPISLLLISGCSGSSNSQDLCNDQAWNACAAVAKKECGLTSTSSDSELAACKPFARCDDDAYASCMSEND